MLRVVLAAAITALMGVAFAGPAAAASAGKATGGGSVVFDENNPDPFAPYNISFTARDTGDENDPLGAKGHVHFKSEGGNFVANVTCYSQTGNEAVFSGEILHGTGAFDPTQTTSGQAFYSVFVRDNGEGGSAVDQISFIAVADLRLQCNGGLVTEPLANGNIQVHE